MQTHNKFLPNDKCRYNRIIEYSSPVEFELVKEEIEELNEQIQFGQENYNWNSPGTIVELARVISRYAS
jgi:hypothetical protein